MESHNKYFYFFKLNQECFDKLLVQNLENSIIDNMDDRDIMKNICALLVLLLAH
jgi:hypothetical protein